VSLLASARLQQVAERIAGSLRGASRGSHRAEDVSEPVTSTERALGAIGRCPAQEL
jgi:hypothetical protein